jgi:DNA-binding NarL/FixJ family response regulator
MEADFLRARELPDSHFAPELSFAGRTAKLVPHVPRFRVLVSHAVPLVSAGISAVLARSHEFELIDAGAQAGENSLRGSRRTAHVVIADVASGLRTLAAPDGCRNVLIVAEDDGEALVRSALSHGARGFLLHTCQVEELAAAVRAIARGATAFSPAVASRIAQSFAYEQLTDRETEVLCLMMRGLSDKDMARELAIALGTVKSHMKAILNKLGAARRTEAAAIAHRRGIAASVRTALPQLPSTFRPVHQEQHAELSQDRATRGSRFVEP